MMATTVEQAQKLDNLLKCIISKKECSIIDYKSCIDAVNSKQEFKELIYILEKRFGDSIDFNICASGSFWVSNVTPINIFLEQGGFTDQYKQADIQNIQSKESQQLEKGLKLLQIKSLEEGLRYSQKSRRMSRIAIVVSIISVVISLCMFLYNVLYKK